TPTFPSVSLAGVPVQTQAVRPVQFNSQTPTVIHYNLEVQRQLTSTLSLRAGYVGSHGYNLSDQTQQDIRIPAICQNGAPSGCAGVPDGTKFFSTSFRFINPNFSSI